MEWIGWILALVLAAVVAFLLLRGRDSRAALDAETSRLRQREDRLLTDSEGLAARAERLDTQRAELKRRQASIQTELERIAGLTTEQARAEIVEDAERTAKLQAAQLARDIEQRARRDAEREARNIIVGAIQRIAAEQTSESVVTVVHLPSDDMKGRIIGREGRNIRAFEQISGANLLIDETPETVLVSCFDPVRRETARIALEELVADGRIHPQRIEEVYAKAQRTIDEEIRHAAEDALTEVGIVDLHPNLVPTLGSLAYRTSYGQNVLKHLVESARIAGLMAAELGLDVATCKRAAFLHDIGKALTHENEGPHALVGADLLRKHGEHEDIVHAVEAHHNEVEPRTVEAILTQAADAISGARPGARRESLEAYIERMQSLEKIALRRAGVARAFAMQAGREVRVMVEPEKIDDAAALVLAREIAKEIEDTLTFPGQIRITVVRESRATATAH
ncbi:MAG TPA: ribonuclease Y [Janibacter terrae]|nr:ribonuclease Y [Janibacter terrae]